MSDTKRASSGLIIFIRNPKRGKVKTRLAQSVGEEKALNIYKALLDHTRETVLQIDVDRLLFYVDEVNRNDKWSNETFTKEVQVGDELGVRMYNAFLTTLEYHDKAVIVGSDIPRIRADIIREAFKKLDEHAFVIGPALDGGYYLLGMKTPAPELFDNMKWSTPEVFNQTIERMRKMGKTWHLLPKLSDIDYVEDWEKYGWELEKP